MNADPIVVAGGGYAGFWAAMAARRIAGPEQPIRMVSRDPILQMRPRLYEAAPETLGIDLRPLLDRTGIDFQAGDQWRHGVLIGSGIGGLYQDEPRSRVACFRGQPS